MDELIRGKVDKCTLMLAEKLCCASVGVGLSSDQELVAKC